MKSTPTGTSPAQSNAPPVSLITAITHLFALVVEADVVLYVQLNCVAAVLSVPNAFVKVLPATSIVVAPSEVGVMVAV